MAERAYTVSEVAALREACENKYLWGVYDRNKVRGFSRSYNFRTGEKDRAVEAMVQRHMLAGHTREDLIAGEATPPPARR